MMFLDLSEGMENWNARKKFGNFEVDDKWQPLVTDYGNYKHIQTASQNPCTISWYFRSQEEWYSSKPLL